MKHKQVLIPNKLVILSLTYLLKTFYFLLLLFCDALPKIAIINCLLSIFKCRNMEPFGIRARLENFSYNLGCFRHAQSLKVYYKSCSISLISCLSEKVDIQKKDNGGIMIRTWLRISISPQFLDNSFGRLDIFNMILKESFQT